jgi:ribonuclease HI
MSNSTYIYTDGGARGNPGPGGAAFVVVEDGKILHKESKFLGISTNNEAEYAAIIMAFEWLKNNYLSLKDKKVMIFLDSQLVARQLSGTYRVKSINLKPFYKKVRSLMNDLSQINISIKSVEREKNKLADKMVNLALDENL